MSRPSRRQRGDGARGAPTQRREVDNDHTETYSGARIRPDPGRRLRGQREPEREAKVIVGAAIWGDTAYLASHMRAG